MTRLNGKTHDRIIETGCKKEMMIGCDLRAVRDRSLECRKALALRTHLARLKMVVKSVCNGKMSSRLRRQMPRIFEHMLDLNRQVTPPYPTRLPFRGRRSFTMTEGEVGQAGLCGRLRSNLSSKLQRAGRRRRDFSPRCRRKFRPFSGRPGATAAPTHIEFESTRLAGTTTVTDKNPLSYKPRIK